MTEFRRLLDSSQTDPLTRRLLAAAAPPAPPPPGADMSVWAALAQQLPLPPTPDLPADAPAPPADAPAPPADPSALPDPTAAAGPVAAGSTAATGTAATGTAATATVATGTAGTTAGAAAGTVGTTAAGAVGTTAGTVAGATGVALFAKPAIFGALAMSAAILGHTLLSPSAPPAPSAPVVTASAPMVTATTATTAQPVATTTAEPALTASAAPSSAVRDPPPVVRATTTAPVDTLVPPGPATASAAPAAPEPAASADAVAAERLTRLREEARLTSEARAALASGDIAGAQQKLAAASAQGGVLAQEREAIAIELLARSGQSAAASQRAQAFLAAYPNSPHAPRVRTFVGR